MTDNTYENDIVIREKIAETMMVEIDDACEQDAEKWRSKRVGSSGIGHSCSRRVWYEYRWAVTPTIGSEKRPAGQVYRLFNRGHREEPEVEKHLTRIGCRFVPPPEGKDQHKFYAVEGHAVTKLDGILYLPEKFGVKEPAVLEIKTANMSGFAKMQKEGVRKAEPKYWAQANFSCELADLHYIVFYIVSKNDDAIHIEFHKAERDYGLMLKDKAAHVITATDAPVKISQSAKNWACKFCDFIDVCHHDKPVEKNCRSCVHARPAEDSQWVCGNPAFGQTPNVIPDDFIPLGCDHWQGID